MASTLPKPVCCRVLPSSTTASGKSVLVTEKSSGAGCLRRQMIVLRAWAAASMFSPMVTLSGSVNRDGRPKSIGATEGSLEGLSSSSSSDLSEPLAEPEPLEEVRRAGPLVAVVMDMVSSLAVLTEDTEAERPGGGGVALSEDREGPLRGVVVDAEGAPASRKRPSSCSGSVERIGLRLFQPHWSAGSVMASKSYRRSEVAMEWYRTLETAIR